MRCWQGLFLAVLLSGLALGALACKQLPSATAPLSEAPQPSLPQFHQEQLPDGTHLYWLFIPADSAWTVVARTPTAGLQPVKSWQDSSRWAVINGGFFDPANGLSTSHIHPFQGDILTPQSNARLMNNPALQRYLSAIINRSEWRTLKNCPGPDGRIPFQYQIARHQDPSPAGCQTISRLGAGPQLLPQLTAVEEGFYDPATGRDPIGIHRPDARSAIGLTANGDVILLLVAQTTSASQTVTGGWSLPQMAEWFRQKGTVSALNLDGGSSSSLWVRDAGEHLAKRNRQGGPIRRPVLSVLSVEPWEALP